MLCDFVYTNYKSSTAARRYPGLYSNIVRPGSKLSWWSTKTVTMIQEENILDRKADSSFLSTRHLETVEMEQEELIWYRINIYTS